MRRLAMGSNEGTWDRVIRTVAGIALLYAAWATWPATAGLTSGAGAVSALSYAIGALAFVTGIVGWCPAYAFFNFSTKKRVRA
jgi:hypothetical protein